MRAKCTRIMFVVVAFASSSLGGGRASLLTRTPSWPCTAHAASAHKPAAACRRSLACRDGIAADPAAELAFSPKLTKQQRASVHG